MRIVTAARVTLIAAALFAIATSVFADEQMRKWRDKSGRFEVEAKLVKRVDGQVQLLKKDGRAVTVAISALSDADQKYLKELEAENPFAGGEVMKQEPGAATPAPRSSSAPGGGLLATNYSPKVLPSDARQVVIDFDEPVDFFAKLSD